MAKDVRVCVYTLKNGKEEVVVVHDVEEEQHERASAEREVSDPKGYVKGYRFERRETKDK